VTQPDPNATLDAGEDPTADTLDGESQDTDTDTQGATVDWETRYKQLQSFSTRQIAALQRQVESAPVEDEDEDEEDDDEEPDPNAGSERLERDSWRLAEQEYGKESVAAYGKAARLLDRASTPADYVGAFEAYYTARLEADTKRYAKESGKAQGGPSQPRIESNRPDAAPRNNLDPDAEAALAKGDSRGYLLAQIRRIRGES
jgi:hypothetical protein